MKGKVSWVITCEHASQVVPEQYRRLFPKAILESHRGFDIGAKKYAKSLAEELSGRLFLGTYTRLLVDLNRSLHKPGLFSDYTKGFSRAEKEDILRHYYTPYRNRVFAHIASEIERGHTIIHLSCHSFTPKLHGKVRNMDLGILYDPHRLNERNLAEQWKRTLQETTSLHVRLNAPYRGAADGHTSALRLCFSPEKYIGIEIEVNQRLFTEEFSSQWENVWFPSLAVSLRKYSCH